MLNLSVIIALYNNRIYIKDCIDSIYQQSLSEDEFEVIVVDDCSTDGGGNWVELYYSNRSNLRVVHHDVNKGLGEVRNTGLKNAKGNYLHFVDADDFILAGSYRYLIDNILPLESDVIYTSFVRNGLVGDCFENKPVSYTGNIREYVCAKSMSVLVWRKIFKRTFIERNKLHWLPISYNEDALFTWNALHYEGSLTTWLAKIYSYRTNENGIIRVRNVEQVKKSIDDLIIVNQQLKSFADYYQNCRPVFESFTMRYLILFNRILCTPYSYKEQKKIFARCAEIGTKHLIGGKQIKIIDFIYRHPRLYRITQRFVLIAYFGCNRISEHEGDYLSHRLSDGSCMRLINNALSYVLWLFYRVFAKIKRGLFAGKMCSL